MLCLLDDKEKSGLI